MKRTLTSTFIILFGNLLICTSSFAWEPSNSWQSCLQDLQERKDIWTCIGKVTIEVKKTTYDDFYDHDTAKNSIITTFTNREILFEDISETTPKKVLGAPQYSNSLFYGITGEKEAKALSKKRTQTIKFLVFVLVAVTKGFPEGVIPHTWESRKVDFEGSWHVSVQKITDAAFKFRIQDSKMNIEGEWTVLKASPWPDSQSMDGWTIYGKRNILTLGEARCLLGPALHHQCR